jgi:hypothetical protein
MSRLSKSKPYDPVQYETTRHGPLTVALPPFGELALCRVSGGRHPIALVNHVFVVWPGLRHYYSELPQSAVLLLKNRSLFPGIRYALFKR